MELLASLLQYPQGVGVKPAGGSSDEWEASVPASSSVPSKQQGQQQGQHEGVQGQGVEAARSAAAVNTSEAESATGALGEVPHMLRGNMTGFSLTCMEGRAFSQCTACSATVVDAYKQGGWDTVLRATQVSVCLFVCFNRFA